MKLRRSLPLRSSVQAETQYRAYKASLRADFDTRCGYCDDLDETYGLQQGFHIDHFAPRSIFPELEVDYENLVYSCPLCNIAKSNKWIGSNPDVSHDGQEGFIDPCLSEYDDHLARSPDGKIIAKTSLGIYLIKNLKLNLLRHELNWKIDSLEKILHRLTQAIDRLQETDRAQHLREIVETFVEINKELFEYKSRRISG